MGKQVKKYLSIKVPEKISQNNFDLLDKKMQQLKTISWNSRSSRLAGIAWTADIKFCKHY